MASNLKILTLRHQLYPRFRSLQSKIFSLVGVTEYLPLLGCHL